MRRAPLLLCLLALGASAPAGAGEVRGRVELGVPGARLADLGPTVVFLEGPSSAAGAGPAAVIRQAEARFRPDFLVVRAGQTVEMPNDDTIFHNVFSFSRPNDFDLGIYPAGSSRNVTFRQAGLVKVYCSIHESMTATVLVVPGPHFARVSGSGDYRIAAVPPGRYRLTVWNEMLPSVSREVLVEGTGSARADVALAAAP